MLDPGDADPKGLEQLTKPTSNPGGHRLVMGRV
jgi:hypothetical protein